MSDWRKGDFALCVADRQWVNILGEPLHDSPRKGRIYTVTAFLDLPHYGGGYLQFSAWPTKAWDDRAFIKVTPSPELIAEERKAGALV